MKRFFLCLFLATLVGCGSGKQALQGTVTFSDDGAPLNAGIVCFTDGVNFSRGTLDAAGKYTVSSLDKNDGILKGEYRVYIQDAAILVDDGRGESTQTLIDSKYASPETSGLTFTADGKTSRYDIKIDRP